MNSRTLARFAAALAVLVGLAAPAIAQAQDKVLCAYDPAGKSGEYFRILEDYVVQAKTWGVPLQIKAYTDEETAAKDYAAKQCDAVVATGVRLQRFNRFSSSIEAIGAITEYSILRNLVNSFVKYPSAAQRLRNGEHETVGVLPAGQVYLFVDNKGIDTVQELGGKRIATMDYDKAAPVMVNKVGAIMVPADLSSLGPKFNNGNVNACYMSALAYEPFELHRGMDRAGGGVVDLPLAMATLQIVARHESFPADFGTKSRAWFAGQFDRAKGAVEKERAKIDQKYWIHIGSDRQPAFEDMFLQVRLELRDTHQAYDGNMLSVLRKLRCAQDPARSECVEKRE